MLFKFQSAVARSAATRSCQAAGRRILGFVLFFLALLGGTGEVAFAQATSNVDLQPITILCYHDVTDDIAHAYPDTVTVSEFMEQMSWIRTQGYTVISAQDYLDYKAGVKPLPRKPLMLTFDDGYHSFYSVIFPILRSLQFPSILAVIGDWSSRKASDGEQLMTPAGSGFSRSLPILNERQIKELSDSGLVEIASHSFDMHRGVTANPEGSLLPSAITPILGPEGYETESEYQDRLRLDLKKSVDWISAVTGHSPRFMVWPYGRFNGDALRAAAENGLLTSLGLGPRKASVPEAVTLGRVYISGKLRIQQFAAMVKEATPAPLHRHIKVTVPISAITAETALNDAWFDTLVQGVQDSGATLVHISPFASNTASCTPLIPSSVATGADVLSKISWQLQSRVQQLVLVDLNLAQCAWTSSQWITFVKELALLSHTNGLVVHADESQTELVAELHRIYKEKDPSAWTGSTTMVPGQSFKLVELDPCSKVWEVPSDSTTLVFEVGATGCQQGTALQFLAKRGARRFGFISQGAVPVEPEGLRAFKGIISFR